MLVVAEAVCLGGGPIVFVFFVVVVLEVIFKAVGLLNQRGSYFFYFLFDPFSLIETGGVDELEFGFNLVYLFGTHGGY